MPEPMQNGAFPAPSHDHDRCVRQAVAHAEQVCADRDLRLTPIRRRVLELIWTNHQPSKAYDLLEAIRGEPFSTAPPTVYRALDFLLDAGLIHRIESLNAYVGCDARHAAGSTMFLICRGCDRVAELPGTGVGKAIGRAAKRAGFAVDQETVEISGLCGGCADDA